MSLRSYLSFHVQMHKKNILVTQIHCLTKCSQWARVHVNRSSTQNQWRSVNSAIDSWRDLAWMFTREVFKIVSHDFWLNSKIAFISSNLNVNFVYFYLSKVYTSNNFLSILNVQDFIKNGLVQYMLVFIFQRQYYIFLGS